MELRVRARATAQIAVENGGALVFVKVTGVAGAHECEAAFHAIRAALAGSPATGVVVDVRGAVLTLGMQAYVELVRVMLWRPVPVPIAFIGSAWLIQMFAAHERLMASRGLKHRAFPGVDQALRWLARIRQPPKQRGLFG